MQENYSTPPHSATAIAVLDQVSYYASGREIVSDVSFEVKPLEILTIIGPNGSGKTTLAKLLLGLLAPSKGTVWRRPDAKIGYVPQKIHLENTFPLTVERFLSLAGGKPDQRYILADEIGIMPLLSLQMHVLSGGEMQKILLAQALLHNPTLLVLDEPIQGMDIQAQKQFYALIERLRIERQCAVMMISHDLHMVMKSSDRVLCMHHHICCEGKPEDVRAHPEYRQLFFAEEFENIAVYRHHHDHVHEDEHCGHTHAKGDGHVHG